MAKEVQMAARAANSTGRSTPPHHHHHSGGAAAAEKPVPGYLRPSAGSCHHVCKYGGTHTFDDKEAKKPHHPKPRRQPPPPPAPAPAPAPERQSKVMVKVRSVFRRRVGDSSRAEKAAAGKAKGSGEGVEWKDIVAYDSTVVPPHGSSSPQPERISAPVTVSGDGKKKDVTKGKKSHDKIKVTGQVNGVLQTQDQKKMDKNAKIIDIKSAKPPKGKKKPKSLMVEKLSIADQDKPLHGYQVLSHSLLQSRASLLRDLEEEMVNEDTNFKETKPTYSLDEEECAAAAETSSRSIPAHRRAKSMSISSSRSVRFPFVRQASKNSATFKLRSRSTKAPILPLEEEKTARLRSRTRGDDPAGGTGRGIQLRIRSLRRRGVGGSGGAGTGFVVPAVALRHQKTLEKKRSQRLYNNMIEETAGKLVKARKSRVKALVGAFESVISKIAK